MGLRAAPIPPWRPPAAEPADLRPVERHPGPELGDPPPLPGGVRGVTLGRDEYLAEHVRDSLIHDPRVNEQDVLVRIKERRVFLGGNVSTRELREAISVVARELLPDYEIVNETTLVPAVEPEDEERVQ
ncbi:MAG: BON domain-containing protein [Chloroflexi bacterium]|nr:MAG: BON domain-containing protein [Chloroflexota bacterium]